MVWLVSLVAAAAWAAAAAAAQSYQAAFAVRDLSPTQEQLDNGEVWLGAYGFWRGRGQPEGVHDPVWARAFVLSDGNGTNTVATAVLDLPGISNRVLRSIRLGVQAATGLPLGSVLVAATHTHSAPDLQGLWGGVSAAYNRTVIDLTVEAIVEAYRAQQPARLFASRGVGFALNRRDWDYTDDELTVLDVHAAEADVRLGTVIQFAAHPTTLDGSNLLVSSDYCHYLRVAAEEALNATVVYFNGAIGDVLPRAEGVQFERAENYGREVAAIALATLATQEEITGPAAVRLDTKYFVHNVTNPALLLANAIGLTDYDFNDDDTVDLQVSYFRIGDALQAVAFPGESLTNNALPIKAAMVTKYRLFLGLTSDTLGYFVPTAEWDAIRGYEEKVSINRYVGDVTQRHLIDLIQADAAAGGPKRVAV